MKWNLKKYAQYMAAALGILIMSLVLIFWPKPWAPLDHYIDSYKLEWGEMIPTEKEAYLKEGLDAKTIDKTVSSTTLLVNLDETSPPGEYQIRVSDGKNEKTIQLIIQDTTAPVFAHESMALTTFQDCEPVIEGIEVTDLGEVTLEWDLSNLNLSEPGEYTVTLNAKDPSGNLSSIPVTITIKEATIMLDKTKLTLEEGQTATLKAAIEGKNQEAAFTSKDTSICSVGQDGSIKALKPGKTTITASANGVEANCEIEVTAKKVVQETPAPQVKPPAKQTLDASTVQNLVQASYSDNLLIISAPSYGSRSATAYYFQKSQGTWQQSFKVPCIVGKAGVGQAHEGSTKTPVGNYGITKLFGIAANPGTQLAYHQLTGSEYWCGGQYYNQWVDETTMDHSGCDKSKDEHLIDYPGAYDYAAAFSFNSSNTPGGGSAFFVHCLEGTYTMGCIGIPHAQMATFMRGINGSTRVIIDVEDNIFNY